MIKVYEKMEHLGDWFQTAWQRIFAYAPLFLINLKVQWFNFKEYLYVVFRYYRNLSFMKADLLLLLNYLFLNPYRMNKQFLKEKGRGGVDVYGETPLTTLEKIAKKCEIRSQDVVYELGSGRGRACFWFSTVIGCKTVGIEEVPEFVSIAKGIQQRCGIELVSFKQNDFLHEDLSEATVLYLYGTCLTEAQISQLIEQLKRLPSGTKVVTVSYPLTDYSKDIFEVMNCFSGTFPWGPADIYVQYRK